MKKKESIGFFHENLLELSHDDGGYVVTNHFGKHPVTAKKTTAPRMKI